VWYLSTKIPEGAKVARDPHSCTDSFGLRVLEQLEALPAGAASPAAVAGNTWLQTQQSARRGRSAVRLMAAREPDAQAARRTARCTVAAAVACSRSASARLPPAVGSCAAGTAAASAVRTWAARRWRGLASRRGCYARRTGAASAASTRAALRARGRATSSGAPRTAAASDAR